MMVTATVSRADGNWCANDVAKTGEDHLQALPVGGVKEKVLAANRYGIDNIVLPSENKRDLEDVPESVRKGIHFHFVKNVDEVLAIAFSDEQIDED